MRTLPFDLAAHIAGGATTLARCWRLIRRDGAGLAFTDHDRDLSFGGVTYMARSGLDAAEATAEFGFAIGGGEAAGALSAVGLTEADLAAGLYDDARVEIWLVNWAAPVQRLLLDVASIGEVTRTPHGFTAELRSAAHRLDETRGRLFASTCAADLGDALCGFNLAAPGFTGQAAVTGTDGARLIVADGLAPFADGFFSHGALTFVTGANGGARAAVALHRGLGAAGELHLMAGPASAIAVGDVIAVTAGCDKRFATCKAKFANWVNFRGFPHMPGQDRLIRGAASGPEVLDGGSLFQ